MSWEVTYNLHPFCEAIHVVLLRVDSTLFDAAATTEQVEAAF
jgi:hypothetical protein